MKGCFDKAEYEKLAAEARNAIDPGASLAKNPALIGEILAVAWAAGKKPEVMVELTKRLMKFAAVGE